MSVATAATPSSAWPRLAPSWASLSGIISAAGSPFPISQPSRASPSSFSAAATQPDHLRPDFCPCYPETGYFLDKARKPLAEAEAILAIKLYDVVGRSAIVAGFHTAQGRAR